jgi:hypothetical protein
MTDNNRLQTIDSLCANEFALEMAGQRLTGIFRVLGFVSFKLAADGAASSEPFMITKMVRRDGNEPLNAWIRETRAAGNSLARPLRTLVLLALDDGIETRRWTIHGARIVQIAYSDFDTTSGEMVEEKLTIAYDRVEEAFPVTGN